MTIETKRLLDRAEAAKRGDLSEIEICRLLAEIESASNAAVARSDDLGTNQLTGKPMPGRAAAMEKGPTAVMAADQEREEIDAALQILDYCRITAEEAVNEARKRDAPPKAAEAIKALPKAVAALEKAKAAHAKARSDVEQLCSQLVQARHLNRDECPALSDDAFEKLATALWRNRVEKVGPEAERSARVQLTGQSGEAEEPSSSKLEFRGFRGGKHRHLTRRSA